MTDDLAEHNDDIVEAFANDSSINTIARSLKVTPQQVREVLANPANAVKALQRKQELFAVELVGTAFDRLAALIKDGEPQHFLQAVRLLHTLTSTNWLPQQRGKDKEEEEEVIEIAGLLEELDDGEPEE